MTDIEKETEAQKDINGEGLGLGRDFTKKGSGYCLLATQTDTEHNDCIGN